MWQVRLCLGVWGAIGGFFVPRVSSACGGISSLPQCRAPRLLCPPCKHATNRAAAITASATSMDTVGGRRPPARGSCVQATHESQHATRFDVTEDRGKGGKRGGCGGGGGVERWVFAGSYLVNTTPSSRLVRPPCDDGEDVLPAPWLRPARNSATFGFCLLYMTSLRLTCSSSSTLSGDKISECDAKLALCAWAPLQNE